MDGNWGTPAESLADFVDRIVDPALADLPAAWGGEHCETTSERLGVFAVGVIDKLAALDPEECLAVVQLAALRLVPPPGRSPNRAGHPTKRSRNRRR